MIAHWEGQKEKLKNSGEGGGGERVRLFKNYPWYLTGEVICPEETDPRAGEMGRGVVMQNMRKFHFQHILEQKL